MLSNSYEGITGEILRPLLTALLDDLLGTLLVDFARERLKERLLDLAVRFSTLSETSNVSGPIKCIPEFTIIAAP